MAFDRDIGDLGFRTMTELVVLSVVLAVNTNRGIQGCNHVRIDVGHRDDNLLVLPRIQRCRDRRHRPA